MPSEAHHERGIENENEKEEFSASVSEADVQLTEAEFTMIPDRKHLPLADATTQSGTKFF